MQLERLPAEQWQDLHRIPAFDVEADGRRFLSGGLRASGFAELSEDESRTADLPEYSA